MSDPRPVNCHYRLRDEGKLYMPHGCNGCNVSVGVFMANDCPKVEPLMRDSYSPETEPETDVDWKARAEAAEEYFDAVEAFNGGGITDAMVERVNAARVLVKTLRGLK